MTFLMQVAIDLESTLVSTFINEIGLQFFINVLSLPFFSISVITACLCEAESSPFSYESSSSPKVVGLLCQKSIDKTLY